MHPEPKLWIPSDIHLEHVGTALRELLYALFAVFRRWDDGMFIHQPVTASANRQREERNHRGARAERKGSHDGCRRRRAAEEFHLDRVVAERVLIDQDAHALPFG